MCDVQVCTGVRRWGGGLGGDGGGGGMGEGGGGKRTEGKVS